MKERPIAFNAAMVKAIMAGNKTHTRRCSRIPQKAIDVDYCPYRKKWLFIMPDRGHPKMGGKPKYRQCPYGIPGDRLWVRENWAVSSQLDDVKPSDISSGIKVFYLADSPWDEDFGKARPAMFMPRCFGRVNHRPSANSDEHNRLGWLLWAQQSLIEQQRLLCARLDELPFEAAEPSGG